MLNFHQICKRGSMPLSSREEVISGENQLCFLIPTLPYYIMSGRDLVCPNASFVKCRVVVVSNSCTTKGAVLVLLGFGSGIRSPPLSSAPVTVAFEVHVSELQMGLLFWETCHHHATEVTANCIVHRSGLQMSNNPNNRCLQAARYIQGKNS